MRIGFPGAEFDAGAQERRTFLDADPEIPLVFTDFFVFYCGGASANGRGFGWGSSRPLHGDTVFYSRTLFLRSLLTTTNLYAIINLSYRNFPHMIACFGKTAAFCEPI